ncbi:hypothetical protein ACFL10_00875 [Patescibacteria group bacterium]
MENPKKGMAGWLKVVIALVVVAAIGAVGYFGATGEFFQGMSFSKSSTDVPTSGGTSKATPIATPITTTVTTTLLPADPKWAYLDRVGSGAFNFLDDDYLYQAIEPAVAKDPLLVFKLKNDGGKYFDLLNLAIKPSTTTYSSCTIGLSAKWNRCNNITKVGVANLSSGASLYLLDFNSSGSIIKADKVANDNNRDNIFYGNEFTQVVRVNGGEEKVLVIVKDTQIVNTLSPYNNPDHLSGWVELQETALAVRDADGVNLYPSKMSGGATVQDIKFR